MSESMTSRIGTIRDDGKFIIKNRGNIEVETNVSGLLKSYKSTFSRY